LRFEDQARVLLDARVPAFSFIYGIPPTEILAEAKKQHVVTLGTATTVDEAKALEQAGVDIVVVSAFEAGGHRGSVLLSSEDSLTGTISLVPQTVDAVNIPVVAAGGIADSRGVKAALALEAEGVQMGTVFLATEESGASPIHREAILSGQARQTGLTRGFTGRLARGIRNRLLTALNEPGAEFLPYPLQRIMMRNLALPAQKPVVRTFLRSGLARVRIWHEQVICNACSNHSLRIWIALKNVGYTKAWSITMKVELVLPQPITEPRLWERPEQVLGMVLRPGSIEMGVHRTELTEFRYVAGEMILPHRHEGKWIGLMKAPYLQLSISDVALMAASGREVELRMYRKFADTRLRALVTAVHAEMAAGFPSGKLFLDSVEQAIAVALINGHAAGRHSAQRHRGGLGSARLRKIKELVDANMDDDLSLDEMAQSVELSTAHFARLFRKSTGETPHQFVLRRRIERAKAMLRDRETRVLDVAVACGFKTQQHFAQVFRAVCGISPTEYRQDFVGSEMACAPEICSVENSESRLLTS
jgi:AraC-like DNA-binding protein